MITFVLHEYQRQRIFTFLKPETDPTGGGLPHAAGQDRAGLRRVPRQGAGAGQPEPRDFLPEKHTDFIYASLGEEFGFIGAFGVLILYWPGDRRGAPHRSPERQPLRRLAATGVTATFGLYVLINAAMIMGLAPVGGIPHAYAELRRHRLC
jgi:rod shape determining protein RodA